MWEDGRLLRRLRKGDGDALRRIYEKYSAAMLMVAMAILKDRPAAEDCLHDVFVRFAGRAAEIRVRSNLRGYLIAAAANHARRMLRTPVHVTSLDGDGQIDADSPVPLAQLAEREEAQRLWRAFERLPVEQREVLSLRLHGGMKFRHIAQELGVSINTVQSRYRYGLEKLRALLAQREVQ